MNDKKTLLEAAHDATHNVPGVPAHVDHASGHQGTTRRNRSHEKRAARPTTQNRNHTSERPPRVLVSWQRRIAALFSRDA